MNLPVGDGFAEEMDAEIEAQGEQLTVYRGNPPTSTQSLWCMPQPYSPSSAAKLVLEGAYNVGEALPYNFFFQSTADVRDADRIVFNGFEWRVLTVAVERNQGVTVGIQALANREKPIS